MSSTPLPPPVGRCSGKGVPANRIPRAPRTAGSAGSTRSTCPGDDRRRERACIELTLISNCCSTPAPGNYEVATVTRGWEPDSMIFTQHYLDCLSQGSYLIGDETTGRAVVVDPRRDIDVYLTEAAEHGLTIERVIETHIHADFLTGHLELAAATGAQISYSEEAELEFTVESLRDGQRISLGEITLEVLATPGHTPESISVVVYEHPDDKVPYGVLTGDTLFVGDVGRPDLLSGEGLSSEQLARSLYHSLHDKLLKLPDATRVFPAHGAGRHAANRCLARPVRRSATSAGTTMHFNFPTSMSSSPRSPRGSRRNRTTSSSTRCATASGAHCSTTTRRPCWASTRCAGTRRRGRSCWMLETRPNTPRPPARCRQHRTGGAVRRKRGPSLSA